MRSIWREWTSRAPSVQMTKWERAILSSMGSWTAMRWLIWVSGQPLLARRERWVTDEQATQDGAEVSASMPAHVPLYTWNLAGYRHGHAPGAPNRHTFGGLTDAAFRMIPLIESGRNGSWPWDTDS